MLVVPTVTHHAIPVIAVGVRATRSGAWDEPFPAENRDVAKTQTIRKIATITEDHFEKRAHYAIICVFKLAPKWQVPNVASKRCKTTSVVSPNCIGLDG